MNSSGSSFFSKASARSLGKRSKRTLFSSSASMYFFKYGLRTSQALRFCFLALWMNSSQRSLSPLRLMVSFIQTVIPGTCIYVLLSCRICITVTRARYYCLTFWYDCHTAIVGQSCGSCLTVTHLPSNSHTISPDSQTIIQILGHTVRRFCHTLILLPPESVILSYKKGLTAPYSHTRCVQQSYFSSHTI